jgi:hypothetical protein
MIVAQLYKVFLLTTKIVTVFDYFGALAQLIVDDNGKHLSIVYSFEYSCPKVFYSR